MDSESRDILQYFSQLTRAETEHIRELIKPFLQTHDPACADIIEQMVIILGEFGARVRVIEQAAEQQLLVENPLHSGPMLSGNLHLSAAELGADGLYDAEALEQGRVLRWTNTPDFTIYLPVYRPFAKTLRIYFSAIIKQEYTKLLKVFIDQQEVPHKLKKINEELFIQVTVPAASNLALTELSLRLPAVHSPLDLGISEDPRELGIAINRITVEDSSSSVIGKLLGR